MLTSMIKEPRTVTLRDRDSTLQVRIGVDKEELPEPKEIKTFFFIIFICQCTIRKYLCGLDDNYSYN